MFTMERTNRLAIAVALVVLVGGLLGTSDTEAACPEPFCDSARFEPCLVICPLGDITYIVAIKDSCGNPVCDMTGTYLYFSSCPTVPCPSMTDWPLAYPDSCDPTTGEHFFNIKASSQDCIDCEAPLYINGAYCRKVTVRFLDIDADHCVFPDDWLGVAPCNDYDCDGAITSADMAIHNTHLDHCCDQQGCPPGPPFCNSTMTDLCLVICPLGDITHIVTVTDSCGNPICVTSGLWLDFDTCPSRPCPGAHPNWPIVYPDSCNPITGEHFFNIKASSLDCVDCEIPLYLNGVFCRNLEAKFLDIDADLCVTQGDWLGVSCNDYDCDGDVDTDDNATHVAHLLHCCEFCSPGPPLCDSTITDPCLVICPLGDITHIVTVTDSCGNPICVTSGLWLDFDTCPSRPCPGAHPNWPIVYPDSCNPITGEHFFNIKASSLDCVDCEIPLYLNGVFCRNLEAKFLDIDADLCVTQGDWLGVSCNDYDCDGDVDTDDNATHVAHLLHCCEFCSPGPPFCDSVTTGTCMVICPLGDITHVVFVKDSCGNPICDASAVWFDFSGCPAIPCPNDTSWPLVFADSYDPATGAHFFNVAAGAPDCITCQVPLFVNGVNCLMVEAQFLDINGDLCVYQDDILAPPCSDYNCDGAIDGNDAAFHSLHIDHCCFVPGEIHGTKWNDLDCDGIWDTGEPPLAGWTINLYQGTTFIGSTVTDALGQYVFTGLTTATYRVTEIVSAGWVQTYPATVYHIVPVTAGSTVTGVDFGNHQADCQDSLVVDSVLADTKDNFVGAEPASPGPDLIPLLTCPLGSTNFFDVPLTNQCFGHTFDSIFDTSCCLLGAQLCFQVTASGVIPNTDDFALANNGVFVWSSTMNDLQAFATSGADLIWSFGDTMEICLDLANLPASSLGITNLLSALQDGDLDIRFADDTEVDYLQIFVEICCPDCCDLVGDIDNNGTGSDIADLIYLVNFMFQNGPEPPCMAEADINGNGTGPDITDLIYLVSFMFQNGPPPVPCQ